MIEVDRERNLFDRALGGDEPPLGLDFDAIEQAGARAVRRRRVVVPAVAAAFAVVLLGGTIMITSGGGPVDSAGSVSSAVPTGPGPSSQVPPTDGGTPAVGVGYPHELNTHCGIRSAHFGGRWWTATAPTGQPHPGGRDTTVGTMTLIHADLARFTWPDGSADFVPLPAEPMPPCQ